jgi:hypothetical protein
MQTDTIALFPVTEKENISIDHAIKTNAEGQTNSNHGPTGSSGRTLKTTANAKPKIIESKAEEKPKAVMQGKN